MQLFSFKDFFLEQQFLDLEVGWVFSARIVLFSFFLVKEAEAGNALVQPTWEGAG